LNAEKTNWAGPKLEYTAVFILFGTIGAALFPWWFGYNPTKVAESEPERGKGRKKKQHR
jgi:hypothetical protein